MLKFILSTMLFFSVISCKENIHNKQLVDEVSARFDVGNHPFLFDSSITQALQTYVTLRSEDKIKNKDLALLTGFAYQHDDVGRYLKQGYFNISKQANFNDSLNTFFSESAKSEVLKQNEYAQYWLKIANLYTGNIISIKITQEKGKAFLSFSQYMPKEGFVKNNNGSTYSIDFSEHFKEIKDKTVIVKDSVWNFFEEDVYKLSFWDIQELENSLSDKNIFFVLEGYRKNRSAYYRNEYHVLIKHNPQGNNLLWQIAQTLISLAGENIVDLKLQEGQGNRYTN